MAGIIIPAVCANAQNQPHVGYVYPAGGRKGTTFEVRVGGQFLEKVNQARVSGDGIEVKVLEYIEPDWKLKRKQQLKLKEESGQTNEVSQASDKAKASEEKKKRKENVEVSRPEPVPDEKPVIDMRKKKIGGKKQKNMQIDDTIVLEVTIAPDAVSGSREIRLQSPGGFSNPMVFQVGDIPEISETIENYSTNTTIPSMPAMMNGQILPGEVKTFTFTAKKGQSLVFAVQARALIPYLADAVPGWFQAVLTLFDSKGNKLAFVDDYQFNPDPVLFYDVQEDGDYKLEIRDSIYRGREDFVYRLSLGELPFIRSIFPLGGSLCSTTSVTVTGVNLPTNILNIGTGTSSEGNSSVSVQKDKLISNRLPFAVDALPEILEAEPNNDAKHAQTVRMPVIINGRIEKPGDTDEFCFDGKKGDKVVVEVNARRLESPLDSIITITDEAGKVLAGNDDCEDKGAGLTTHHADSCLIQELAGDGKYFVSIGDTQGKGGESYSYRLRISQPQPDFALRVVPATVSLKLSGMTPVTVYALRKDGFKGKIALSIDNAPKGCTLNPSFIPENADKARLTIVAGKKMEPGIYSPVITGSAQVQGRTVSHTAVPAEDLMQAFAYRHLVPSQELVMNVIKGGSGSLTLDIPEGRPLLIPEGGSVKVTVKINDKKPFNGKIKIALDDPPKGISVDDVTPPDGSRETEVTFRADDDEVKAGSTGTIILHGVVNQRSICAAPAIAYEVTAGEPEKEKK